MKNKIIFMLGLMIMLGHSCKKEDNENSSTNGGGTISAAFTCKIDGAVFTADSARINTYSGGFSIMAFKGGSTAFEINLKEPAAGKHALAAGSNEAATYITGSEFFVNTSGEVVIAAFDANAKTANGTFYFAGTNGSTVKNFTEGTFSIK